MCGQKRIRTGKKPCQSFLSSVRNHVALRSKRQSVSVNNLSVRKTLQIPAKPFFKIVDLPQPLATKANGDKNSPGFNGQTQAFNNGITNEKIYVGCHILIVPMESLLLAGREAKQASIRPHQPLQQQHHQHSNGRKASTLSPLSSRLKISTA